MHQADRQLVQAIIAMLVGPLAALLAWRRATTDVVPPPHAGPGADRGGRRGVRITDSTLFPAASTITAARVEIEPGAMPELHWHPNADEWQYYLSGQGRMTVFASGGKARTFDYQAGMWAACRARWGTTSRTQATPRSAPTRGHAKRDSG